MKLYPPHSDDDAASRETLHGLTHAGEAAVIGALTGLAPGGLDPAGRGQALLRARRLVERCRSAPQGPGTLDVFLRSFGLTSHEGTAILCLAEALLRVPDDETADRLIAQAIHSGDWHAHLGESRSPFVNATIWGLMLTGRLVTLDDALEHDPAGWLHALVGRLSEDKVSG